MLTNIISNSTTLLDQAKYILDQLIKEIGVEAIALKANFNLQKEALQREELRKLEQSLGDATKAIKRAESPLNFSVCIKDDRLEMSWWTRKRNASGTLISERVPWGRTRNNDQRGYYLPGLLAETKKWEVGLVREVEAHAVRLRGARAELLELRKKLDTYLCLLDQTNGMPRREGA